MRAEASSLPAYLGLFRMRFLRGLSYRAAALAGTATQFFWGFVLIMVLQAFARSGSSPLDPSQIASYIWLQQAFLALIVVWFRDKELLTLIATGDSAYELCRPVDAYALWFARLAAGRLAAAALRCAPILLVAALLPSPFRLGLPASPASGLYALACLALGLLLIVAITMFAYVLSVVSLSPNAPFMFAAPIFEFAAGMVIPLPFMPEGLRRLMELLPFRLCVDLPLRLYSGSIPPSQAPRLILQQALWIALLVPLGKLALARALRGSQAAGG
jgi:ABC-2 type transport system permease protein